MCRLVLLLPFFFFSHVVQAQLSLFVRAPSGSPEDALPEMLARVLAKYGVASANSVDNNANRLEGRGWVSLETGGKVDIGSGKRKVRSPAKRQDGSGMPATASIVNLQHDTAYYAPVGIGTPMKYYNVILDTGSSELWVTSNSCQKCPGETITFDPSTSSTFTFVQRALSLQYGSGAVTGVLGSDIVSLPATASSNPLQFVISSQTFGVMDKVASEFLRPGVSGTFGLAFQTISPSKTVPVWERLAKQGAWMEPLMAFYFTRYAKARDNHGAKEPPQPGGQFTMGGTNSSLYTGDIDFVSIPQGLESYWLIPLSSVHVGSSPIDLSTSTSLGGQLAAIDTGTSLIGGPADAVSKIYANINGARRGTGANAGYYSIPCNTSVPVSFTFTSQTWNISAGDLQFGPTDDPSGQYCVGAFFEANLGGAGQVQWVIAQAFLKNVYSVYRYSPAAVGFARLSGIDGSLPFPDTSSTIPNAPQSKPVSGVPKVLNAATLRVISTSLLASIFSLLGV